MILPYFLVKCQLWTWTQSGSISIELTIYKAAAGCQTIQQATRGSNQWPAAVLLLQQWTTTPQQPVGGTQTPVGQGQFSRSKRRGQESLRDCVLNQHNNWIRPPPTTQRPGIINRDVWIGDRSIQKWVIISSSCHIIMSPWTIGAMNSRVVAVVILTTNKDPVHPLINPQIVYSRNGKNGGYVVSSRAPCISIFILFTYNYLSDDLLNSL